MTPSAFASLFLVFLALSLCLRLWLALRQIRHVAAHRAAVPPEFVEKISLQEHQKAADYSIAKTRLGINSSIAETALLLGLTLGGGVQALYNFWAQFFANGGYAHSLALFASLAVASFLVELPFSLYRTFRIEAAFGFNKLTPQLWLADLFKGTALGIAIGAPVILAVLWLMGAMGAHWWFYVWLFWMGFNLLVLLLYPSVIAPLFNKFSPLEDDSLKARIEGLLKRCGFTSAGLFVMDGSRRSAHGNAYFTGFGAAKRIVFFDTLIERLSPPEVEAVLAHELGHYKHGHIKKRIAMLAIISLAFLWLLGQLIAAPWFYAGLGMPYQGTAVALILFSLALPVFTFPLGPLSSALSRKHEYEADAYAATQTQATDLVTALVKLYRDNASTLTPDPLHSLYYDSHPPASARIAQLTKMRQGAHA
ncbi:MAG TPA: M48 family metallopeptidase [Rhodocyclaceae bacterium]|jgi:STE24 endopeptidase|nr:M48 family metallopeptidase [Rhodocyclaceae bacterium]